MLPFERVSLDLATLCGAIPLDNFLANDYDDSGELDYRQFEKEDIRYQEHAGNRGSDSEESQRTDGEGDAVRQMLLEVDGSDRRGGGDEEDGFARRGSRLRGSEEEGARTLNEVSYLASGTVVDGEAGSDPLESIREAALGKLYNACTRLSGTVEALHFEFIEETPSNIQCILTVTIPMHTGTLTRCYTTSNDFTRRSDAKGEAARIAIDMDVIGFLKSASSANISRDRAALLARATEKPATQVDIQAGMKARQDIDRICKEWRVDVTPEYTLYRHRKGKERETGCALRISLTPHVKRVFSTDTEFSDPEVAKAACALLALEEGVMDFIMRGNGQKSKPQAKPEQRQLAIPVRQVPSYIQMSVQEFFEALPRPFVEPIEDGKLASDIQWANMLNMIIQGAKMHGMKTMFYFTDTETRTGLTGCVLRVVVSDPSVLSIVSPSGKEVGKTYVVDPHFVKTNDAKTAACMVAITQNLRGYLSEISQTYDKATKHSRELDRKVSEVTFRTILKLLKRKSPPTFEYTGSGKPNGFGCSLSVNTSSDVEAPEERTFSTPTSHYGSKPDARIAALVEAARGGIVEQLLFRSGERQPIRYRSFWEVVSQGGTFEVPSTKLRDGEVDDTENPLKAQKKKRKRTNGQKLPLKLDISKATSAQVRPAKPSGNGSEPGEISESEPLPPSKRIAPPKIIRSASNLSNQSARKLSTAPKEERTSERGGPGISPNPKGRQSFTSPVLRRPPPQRPYPRNSSRAHNVQTAAARAYPRANPPQPPHDDHHYPHTYSRPPTYSAGPPPPQHPIYPEGSTYPPPSYYGPPETSELRPPYPSQPPISYYHPPSPKAHSPHAHLPYGYEHPPSSSAPLHPRSPYDYPDPHPSIVGHDFDTHHRLPRDPPQRHTYPYDGYPAHMIPRDTARMRDYETCYQEDYSMPGVEDEREYWSRREEGPRYCDTRGDYDRGRDRYPL